MQCGNTLVIAGRRQALYTSIMTTLFHFDILSFFLFAEDGDQWRPADLSLKR
jgi:hypothetical protein